MKVFIPGLIRSDVAFIDRVVATVRRWRQYVRSLNRLYTMESKARQAAAKDSIATQRRASGEEMIVRRY